MDVYKITNRKNGKIYIGITNQGVATRWYKYVSDANGNSPFPIHNAIRKYGRDSFTIESIQELPPDTDYDELKNCERFWIAHYDSYNRNKGYNLTLGGDGTFGRYHSEETKEKIRQKAIGRVVSQEVRQKMSESQKNVERDYSALGTEGNKKRWSDPEERRKASESNHRNRKVLQYTKEMEFIAEFNNVADAGREINKHPQNIATCARGKLKTAYGYIWKYKE